MTKQHLMGYFLEDLCQMGLSSVFVKKREPKYFANLRQAEFTKSQEWELLTCQLDVIW